MNKKLYWILISFVALFVVVKAVPYMISGLPFGYDPGFYKSFFDSYFAATPVFDYQLISPWIKKMYEPFLGSFSIVLQLIWYSVDFILWYWLIFFSAAITLFIYLVLNPYGKKYALIGMALFLISITQYQTFWRCYYKQILWIILILTSIALVYRKKYRALIPVLIWAFTIQRPTWVFLLGTFVVYFIIDLIVYKTFKKQLFFIVWLSWLIAAIFYIPFLDTLITPLVQPLVNTIFYEGSSWTFFSITQYLQYSWPYLLLAAVWIFFRIREKKSFDMIDAWFVFGVLRVWLRLFFYNRMIIFLDFFSILLAAWTLWYFLKKKWGLYLLWLFIVWQTVCYGSYLYKNNFTLAEKTEISFLSTLKSQLPSNALMIATSSNYTPWVVWYTQMRTMAPGLLDRDPWTKAQWIQRWKWDGKFKCDLMRSSNIQKTNVYMYIGVKQFKENIDKNDCFTLIYNGSWYYLFSVNLENHDK